MVYGWSYGETTAHPESVAARKAGRNRDFMGDLHAKWRLDPFVAKRFVLFLERRVSCKRVAKKDVTTQFEAIIQTGRF